MTVLEFSGNVNFLRFGLIDGGGVPTADHEVTAVPSFVTAEFGARSLTSYVCKILTI